MSANGHRTKWCRNIAENFNRLSRAHERYRQTTDDRQTDGRWHIANVNVSSRSLKRLIWNFWEVWYAYSKHWDSLFSSFVLVQNNIVYFIALFFKDKEYAMRKVLISIDWSETAEKAFDCTYKWFKYFGLRALCSQPTEYAQWCRYSMLQSYFIG